MADEEFMSEPSGPFFVDTPNGQTHEFTCRLDLWDFLHNMVRDERMTVVVRTGFALAPTVMREDDGEYVFSLLSMQMVSET